VPDRFRDALEAMRGVGGFGIGTRHGRSHKKLEEEAPGRRRVTI
jgi:hypothetical protein